MDLATAIALLSLFVSLVALWNPSILSDFKEKLQTRRVKRRASKFIEEAFTKGNIKYKSYSSFTKEDRLVKDLLENCRWTGLHYFGLHAYKNHPATFSFEMSPEFVEKKKEIQERYSESAAQEKFKELSKDLRSKIEYDSSQ